MIGDYWNDKWKDQFPLTPQNPTNVNYTFGQGITREEFNALKREVETMKELMKRAKVYDEENNEPYCEMDEKVALLKKMAEFVGVNLDEIFKK